jgi:hypothetical protein
MNTVKRDEQFSIYKVTNANMLFEGDLAAKKFGDTGELEVSAKTKEINKVAEGIIVDTKSAIEEMTLKYVGHITREMLRDVFGISTEGLKSGVYSYGANSKGKKGTLTFDEYDLWETDTLMIAYPVVTIASGLELKIKNGEDEVAEIELEFKVLPDKHKNYHYEAFKSELDETLVNEWHTKFDQEKIREAKEGE